jgi:hypothetical protein
VNITAALFRVKMATLTFAIGHVMFKHGIKTKKKHYLLMN